MGLSIIRYDVRPGQTQWALCDGALARPLLEPWKTTADVLGAADAIRQQRVLLGEPMSIEGLTLRSPVTRPCQVFAQAVNYKSHIEEVGKSLDDCRDNILFRKSAASIGDPTSPVTRPAHVSLLDYEVELGVVLGRDTDRAHAVTAENLADYIGGFVLTNDLSARDVQIPQWQFYKGKSYRGFTPCGPVLFLPDPEEVSRWGELRMRLSVNGELRQDSLTGDMIHGPAATLTELSQIEDMSVGDLLLTGTPAGVALSPPGKLLQALSGFLPEAKKWDLFKKGQEKMSGYLSPGDLIEASIRTEDGAINLGVQRFVIAAA